MLNFWYDFRPKWVKHDPVLCVFANHDLRLAEGLADIDLTFFNQIGRASITIGLEESIKIPIGFSDTASHGQRLGSRQRRA